MNYETFGHVAERFAGHDPSKKSTSVEDVMTHDDKKEIDDAHDRRAEDESSDVGDEREGEPDAGTPDGEAE